MRKECRQLLDMGLATEGYSYDVLAIFITGFATAVHIIGAIFLCPSYMYKLIVYGIQQFKQGSKGNTKEIQTQTCSFDFINWSDVQCCHMKVDTTKP